jgi:uncharacterized Tic20 family protein
MGGQAPPGYVPPDSVRALGPEEQRVWAMLCHLSYLVLGIVGPLVVMLTLGKRSPYVRHHAVEALNFHITIAIAVIACGLLGIAIVGLFLLPLVLLAGLVFAIVAAVQAYRGQLSRYPVTLRLVT